jgi:bleomycin hydrolase
MKILNFSMLLLPCLTARAGHEVTIVNSEEALEGSKVCLLVNIPTTPVKNQYKTNTCWSFCGISLIETELIRSGKGVYDLSEMFVIHHNYERKAERYVRMHGKTNFSPGGETNDVTDVINEFGIVPEEVYTGRKTDSEIHLHTELDRALEKYMNSLVANTGKEISPVWEENFEQVLDSYLGEIPDSFVYNGKKQTPGTFAASLGLHLENYVMITSFMKYPYFQPVILEIPDNWSWANSYNVPLDLLEAIVDTALYRGYSVGWSTDISESGFNFKKGLALIPALQYAPEMLKEENRWIRKSEDEIFSMTEPVEELNITPEIRQTAFDNYSTTDDHGMQILGIAKDKSGTLFYYVKNSWGTNNPLDGFILVSRPYFQYKTISIMVNKEALTPEVRVRLNL